MFSFRQHITKVHREMSECSFITRTISSYSTDFRNFISLLAFSVISGARKSEFFFLLYYACKTSRCPSVQPKKRRKENADVHFLTIVLPYSIKTNMKLRLTGSYANKNKVKTQNN